MSEKKVLPPLFSHSMGESKHEWNNLQWKADGPITCELCGTEWYAREDGYSMIKILKRTAVRECCGYIADILYSEWAEEFAIAYLGQFATNPFDSRFGVFRLVLKDALKDLQRVLLSIVEESCEFIMAAEEVSGALDSEEDI